MHCKIFTIAAVSHSHGSSLVNYCYCCMHPIYAMMLLTFCLHLQSLSFRKHS